MEIVPMSDPDNGHCDSNIMVLLYYFLFKILSAGSEPNLFHWQLNGDPKAQVPCTPNSVFTIQVNSKSPKNKVTWSSDNVFSANYTPGTQPVTFHHFWLLKLRPDLGSLAKNHCKPSYRLSRLLYINNIHRSLPVFWPSYQFQFNYILSAGIDKCIVMFKAYCCWHF